MSVPGWLQRHANLPYYPNTLKFTLATSNTKDTIQNPGIDLLCLENSEPGYLYSVLKQYEPCKGLRSQRKNNLLRPTTIMNTVGNRSFQHAAATLWNNTPIDLHKSHSLHSFK